jgi:predicted nucleic acid-binding protein
MIHPNKKKYVIDASVFVKLLLNEDSSNKAERLIHHIIRNLEFIVCPPIFFYEVVGVLKKNKCSNIEIQDFLKNFLLDKEYIIEAEEKKNIINKALEISMVGNEKSGYPSFHDSSYHALAILCDCDFITADRRHYEKTKKLGHIKLL